MAGTTPASPLADVDGCAVASGGCAGWCRDTVGASTAAAAAPPDTSCRVMARLAKVGHGPAHCHPASVASLAPSFPAHRLLLGLH